MATDLPAVESQSLRRLSVDDTIAMSEAGIIGDTERVELVGGVLVRMSPEGRPHAWVTARLHNELAMIYYPRGYLVRRTPRFRSASTPTASPTSTSSKRRSHGRRRPRSS